MASIPWLDAAYPGLVRAANCKNLLSTTIGLLTDFGDRCWSETFVRRGGKRECPNVNEDDFK